jgi:hypothetical protein
MLFDDGEELNIGFSKEDVPLDEANNIINFLEQILYKLISEIEENDDEEDLTQKLVQLSNATDSVWVFVQENKNKKVKSKEDIGISPKSRPTKVFFVLEAKRLPSSSKKEYIIGNTGGIERFKKDKHGKNFQRAGMIGYVQTYDFDTWKNKINSWIDEEIISPSPSALTWITNDKLVEQSQNFKIAQYTSIHNCLSKKNINLTHLWVKLN